MEAEVLLVRIRGVEVRQMCRGVLPLLGLQIIREGDGHSELRMGEVGVQGARGRWTQGIWRQKTWIRLRSMAL